MANLPTFFKSTDRSGEVALADWTDGLNRGGSCANGIGINTGDFDPKESDWARIEDTAAQKSMLIGDAAATLPIEVDQNPDFNDNVAFVQADGETAPDAVLDVATGAVNKTGKTVPANSWAWGVIPVA